MTIFLLLLPALLVIVSLSCFLCFRFDYAFIWNIPIGYATRFLGVIILLLVNSTTSFLEENNASNDVATLMAHLAPKTKDCQHILIWSSNDVAPFVTCPKTSLGPKLCGQVFWFMWWIISTWWRFSCFKSNSVIKV